MINSISINRLFISVVILMPALTRLFDIKIVTTYHLDLLLYLLAFATSVSRDSRYLRFFVAPPLAIWGIWEIYSLANWYFIGLRPDGVHAITFFWRLLQVYFMCVTIAYEGASDFKGTLKWIIGTFIVYIVIGLTLQGNDVGDTGAWVGRGGLILRNKLPLTCCALSFVSFFAYTEKYISKKMTYAFIILCVMTIIWVATRKAMFAMFILIGFFAISQINYKNSRNQLKFIAAACALYIFYYVVMNYTLIGQRIVDMEEKDMYYGIEVPSYLGFLGDRSIHYLLGFQCFLENPINGLGISNFPEVTQFPTVLHTEYMVQLCEGGIIGTVLYVLFQTKMLKYSLRTKKKVSDSHGLILIGGICYILFVSLTTWTYDGVYYWVVYGVMIAYWIRNNIIKI